MLPSDAKERKDIPIYSGCIRYFPDAIAAVAQLSFIGNKQHNPGQALHWAKDKSTDELDAEMRHMLDHAQYENGGTPICDKDGVLHAVKNAWRALANLQRMADAGINILARDVSIENVVAPAHPIVTFRD